MHLRRTALCFFAVAVSVLTSAQTATIGGTITDSSGAAVAGATLTAKDVSNNATRVVSTSKLGAYSITSLRPGTYEVRVEKETFAVTTAPEVKLTVDQNFTLNLQLQPATVREEVRVSADSLPPPIDLESAQVSNLVTQTQMQALPLVTRDPYQLILLSPGTIQSDSTLGGFSVNGARERDNNFLLDGLDNNDTTVPGIPGGLVRLNPEATQEFRVITNSFMPEFGRNNGAIVDVITRSGTNELHGNAYWFGRYNALGARDFFNPGPEKQNPYVRNQFGFSLGGPIIKDKTFFFVNNEFQRFRTTLTEPRVVPTAAFKSGLFTFAGQSVDLTSPTSPNNPQGLAIDPTLQQILALFPSPNGEAVDDVRGIYRFPSASKHDVYALTTKFDHRLTQKYNLSVRYAYNNLKDPDPLHDEFLPGLGATLFQIHTHNLAVELMSTLRPTVVNEAKVGFNRNDSAFGCGAVKTIDSIGFLDPIGRGRDFLLPASIGAAPNGSGGFACFPTLVDSNGQTRRTGTYTYGDNLTWVKGSHTMKMGGEFRRIFEDGYNSFNSRDSLTFLGFFSGVPYVNIDPSAPCDPTTGDGCGSATLQNMGAMLFGSADSEFQSQFFNKAGARTANDFRRFREHEYALYWQDNWKPVSNLALNFGLRYQFNGVPFERDGLLSNLFTNASGPAPLTFQLVGPGTGRLLYNNDSTNFEPRVGFALDPFHKGTTSIRGAFGIFHDRVFGNLFGNARSDPPFQESVLNFPFVTPTDIPVPISQAASATVPDGVGIFPYLFDPGLQMPYSENWNFGFQQQLHRDLILDVNYVGSHGVHLLRVVDGNPPNPALVNALIQGGVSPDTLQFITLYFGAEFGLLPSDPVGNNAFFDAALNKSSANSIYHGLQANVTKRISHGFQIQASYTWAHAIDDASDPLVSAKGGQSFPRNSYNLAAERGNSDFDIRQRLVINYYWELPFGRGRTYAGSGVTGKILEGWSLAGVTTFQAGHPFEINTLVDSEHTAQAARADLVGNPTVPTGAPRTETGPPFSAFAAPPFERGGNVGRNHFFGPGYNNFDLVVAKLTSISERVKLETRIETYNLFNRVQFDQPGNQIQDPSTFGLSTNTITRADGTTSARQLQVAMKLVF